MIKSVKSILTLVMAIIVFSIHGILDEFQRYKIFFYQNILKSHIVDVNVNENAK